MTANPMANGHIRFASCRSVVHALPCENGNGGGMKSPSLDLPFLQTRVLRLTLPSSSSQACRDTCCRSKPSSSRPETLGAPTVSCPCNLLFVHVPSGGISSAYRSKEVACRIDTAEDKMLDFLPSICWE